MDDGSSPSQRISGREAAPPARAVKAKPKPSGSAAKKAKGKGAKTEAAEVSVGLLKPEAEDGRASRESNESVSMF